jgi:hypothetical protein
MIINRMFCKRETFAKFAPADTNDCVSSKGDKIYGKDFAE